MCELPVQGINDKKNLTIAVSSGKGGTGFMTAGGLI